MRHKGPLLRGLDFAARTSEKFNRDHLSAFSAQATFYLMLAIFPFVMLLCLAIRLLPCMSKDTLLMAVGLIPESYRSFITEMINGYFNDNFGYVGIALIIFLIWTASRFMQALINGFNTAYGIEENRNQVVLRLIGCLYTVVLCGILVCLVVMYALGTKIVGLMINFAPALLPLEFLITLARNLAMPALLLLIFWMSYVFLPSRKGHFLDELPGALLTTIVWRGSAALYGFFVQMSMDRYSYVYGTLTGVVMILIWLYTDMFFWVVGAELNSFVLKYKSEHPPLRNAYRKSKLFRKKNQNPPPDQQNQSR